MYVKDHIKLGCDSEFASMSNFPCAMVPRYYPHIHGLYMVNVNKKRCTISSKIMKCDLKQYYEFDFIYLNALEVKRLKR